MLIREAKESGSTKIAKVQVDTWQSAYRVIVPDDYTNSLTLIDWRDNQMKL